MKILLIHYRYSIIGGPERYLFNIKSLLEKNNHQVIPFSIEYTTNDKTNYSHYFVKPPTDQFHAHKLKLLSTVAIKTGINIFFNKDAYKALNNVIAKESPDIAYILIYWKLSVSIFKSLKENNIPIILRISDFSYFCSRGVFMKNNKICEKCLNNSLNRIKYKCSNNSLLFSIIDYLRREYEMFSNYYDNVNELIIPSKFTADYYSKNKIFKTANINHIPTFYLNESVEHHPDAELRYNCRKLIIFSRISKEKGVEVFLESLNLLKATTGIDFLTTIIGFDNSVYSLFIRSKIQKEFPDIKCYNFLKSSEIKNILRDSTYTVIPSTCYDNMPNNLIESLSNGIPVIASRIGSFRELIIDESNGFLFNVNDPKALSEVLTKAFSIDLHSYKKMAKDAQDWAKNYCSEESHYEKLLTIFSKYTNEDSE